MEHRWQPNQSRFLLLHVLCLLLQVATFSRTAAFPSQFSHDSWLQAHVTEEGVHRLCIRAGGQSAGSNSYDRSELMNPELYLGKDRELVHFSVDLRWIWLKLTDKHTYINFLKSTWNAITSIYTLADGSNEVKDSVIDIMYYIRSINDKSPLKFFHGSLSRAEWLATTTGRFLLVYIEEGSSKTPSITSLQYRHALADTNLGQFINEQFIFYAGTTQHRSTNNLAKALIKGNHNPFVTLISSNMPKKGAQASPPKFTAVFQHGLDDINPDRIVEFLQRFVCYYNLFFFVLFPGSVSY